MCFGSYAKPFFSGRLLGDQKVRDIDREGGSEGEKSENMLLQWRRTKARDATYRALVKVLRDLENNATADRVEVAWLMHKVLVLCCSRVHYQELF